MHRVLLVHWKVSEVPERLARLKAAGFDAETLPSEDGSVLLRAARADPPDAIVIDLGRLPSHGGMFAMAVRQSAATRRVPLVLVEGDPAKVAALRALLPDASYTSWAGVGAALTDAIRWSPPNPVVPEMTQKYADTPLPKKLGITSGTVLLLDAPPKFPAAFGLPEDADVTFRTSPRGTADVIFLFARSQAAHEKRLPAAQRCLAAKGGLWIAWPKQSSGVETDLTQNNVRALALESGLVDYKICSIDQTWSGLKFARAKPAATASKARRAGKAGRRSK